MWNQTSLKNMPAVADQVLAYNKKWKSENNPLGIRLGFRAYANLFASIDLVDGEEDSGFEILFGRIGSSYNGVPSFWEAIPDVELNIKDWHKFDNVSVLPVNTPFIGYKKSWINPWNPKGLLVFSFDKGVMFSYTIDELGELSDNASTGVTNELISNEWAKEQFALPDYWKAIKPFKL